MVYKKSEIERILQVAITTARSRKRKLCSVDKANVLETSVLWRKTVTDYMAQHAPDIALSHMYVDNAAMQLARDPNQFDVFVTVDRNLSFQQNLRSLRIAVVVLVARSNRAVHLEPLMSQVAEALPGLTRGQVIRIGS